MIHAAEQQVLQFSATVYVTCWLPFCTVIRKLALGNFISQAFYLTYFPLLPMFVSLPKWRTKFYIKRRRDFFLCRCDQTRAMASSFTRFPDHTQRRSAVGRTPLGESSAWRRDIYLKTRNSHNRLPCPRRVSNPQFQQASGRRPTP
jgi:hypothetical protein